MRLPLKDPFRDSQLCRYSPLISKCLRDHVLYLARFQVALTCVNLLSFPNKSRDASHDLHQPLRLIT